MEFLVEFEVGIPDGTTPTEVEQRQNAEGLAAAKLAAEGHLLRVWKRPVAGGAAKVVGLYRAEDEGELAGLLEALPLFEWMKIAVTPLDPHPNDPGAESVPNIGAAGSES